MMQLGRLGGGLVPRERSRRWIFVSAAIHIVVIAILWTFKQAPRPVVQLIQLDDGGRAATMPTYQAPARSSRASPVTAGRPAAPAPAAVPFEVPSQIIAQVTPDSLPIDTHGTLEPRYEDGRLWVRVSDVTAGNLPAKRDVKEMPNHVARVDSALAEKIRSYLDTVPPDSFATRPGPKAWTTEIAGQPWGLDGKWIYLGPIKIPTAILALLPLPAGNYDLAQRNMQLQAMREDIMQAAQRAQSAEEFKKYVKELRERKDVEHQQRIPPDTTKRQPLIP